MVLEVKTINRMEEINMTVATTQEIAVQIGAVNWIEEGTAQRGWYTCLLTDKKFRGADAEAQFALQESLIAAHRSELVELAKKEVATAHEAHLQAQEDAAAITHKTDIQSMTDEQHERLLETGFAGISKRQYDLYTHDRDRMSGSLWNHLGDVDTRVEAKPIKLITIKCACGDERKIKPQDQFQVTRCVPCQIAHRNAIRAEKRKAKRAAAKVTPAE